MILGIDIGGTDIKFGLVDGIRLLKKWKIPTDKAGGGLKIVTDIICQCRLIQTERPFDRIGIGTPGTVDYEAGICHYSANLPYRETPMKALIEEALGVPVYLFNDATCAIGAELHAGIGREKKHFIMLTLGTGVGGGIVIDGKPYTGALGGAAEFGHMVIHEGGLLCGCGHHGCLEQYASVTALIRQTKQAAQASPGSILAQLCEEEITGKTVFDAKAIGCPVAEAVVEGYLRYLTIGIRSLIRIFQPEALVLGGAITVQGDALLRPIREKITQPTEILISALKNDAGVVGAAVLAAEK